MSATRLSRTARSPFAVLLVAAITFLLAACGGTGSGGEGGGATATSEPDFPDVSLMTYQGAEQLGGDEFQLASLLSQNKPIVVNFWAGLCPPCRAEMPDFQRIFEERGDEVIIVGIDIGPFVFLGSRDDGKALLAELGVTYPAATTLDNTVVQRYQVAGMPTTVFISPKGQITRKWSGLLTYEKINEFIDQAKAS